MLAIRIGDGAVVGTVAAAMFTFGQTTLAVVGDTVGTNPHTVRLGKLLSSLLSGRCQPCQSAVRARSARAILVFLASLTAASHQPAGDGK